MEDHEQPDLSKEELKQRRKEEKRALKKAKREARKEAKQGKPKEQKDPKEEPSKTPNRSEWAVWIGNLPYSTTQESLIEFFKPCGGTITRVKLPKKNGQISGFAFVDFDSEAPMQMALAYSEQTLGGRAVLIKNAKDFAKTGMSSRVGRPTDGPKEQTRMKARQNNPPGPTLFLGNLSYDTTKGELRKLFKPFGELVGVRVATFEDNQDKCKGFAYIDFKYTDDATRAMRTPELKQIGGRRTRIEYAGDEATRKGRPWEADPKTKHSVGGTTKRPHEGEDDGEKKTRKLETDNMAETKLQGLPVEFEGQKVSFGE